MHARHRSALILGLLAVALFLLRWPLDSYTCDMRTWGKYRPSAAEGTNFVQTVFHGGGGTPAVFAMLGGQRYMVANIMWQYSDILFHKGKLYDMVAPMDAAVTLNPAFTEAWSTYGWHLAWNIYSYTDDPIEKKRWQDAGIQVFIRAVKANPSIPIHRADLANVYAEREGNIYKAMKVLQPVVESGKFPPLTQEIQNKYGDNNSDITDRYWNPYFIGHRLAICYKRMGIFSGDWRYIQKSIDTYRVCLRLQDPKQQPGTQRIIDEMVTNFHNEKWLMDQRTLEGNVRTNFGLSNLDYGKPAEQLFPESTTGIEDVDNPKAIAQK